MTADEKYFLLNRDNFLHLLQMQLPQKQKALSECFSASSKSRFNFEPFDKKMTLIANLFLNLQTPKIVIRKMSKKSHSRGPFDK